ncbi:hypothetical protein WKI71_36725 [Streptomyces sp. MS1.AVA.1]|uniref:Uncharacterized protein n=1 Tax=Streptomyces machairae TaxID=3134109 RepID=A0ABU8UTJ1_9ACTN
MNDDPQTDRRERYAAAMDAVTGGICPTDLIDAVMAVADTELAARRAADLRDAEEICDEAGASYTAKALNEQADGAYALMARFRRKAEEAEQTAASAAPVAAPPTEQAALREQIAEALWTLDWDVDQLSAEAAADAVLAILPPPADRAAAAAVCVCGHCEVVARELRRLAAETPQPETQAARCRCGHPADEHSVYGCADGCGCERMPKRQPMNPWRILGIDACPTPMSHNWGCGCPTDQLPLHAQSETQTARCGPVPDTCDAETGEPCANHEREQAHAEGEHCFCGPECTAPAVVQADGEA